MQQSPLLWNDGISAIFLSYDYLNYNYHKNNYNLNNQYLSLNGGVNINGWSFRHRGSYTRDSNQHSKYSSFNNYIEHDIDSINGRITIGDFITNSNIVNNFSMRGIQIAKVGQMTPQSQRGFVPDIRGVADTNARIQIRQKNQIIYETVVPPGPFNISDLYSTPYNGDLEVSILESNGTVNKFIVPFSSSSNMLRLGNIEYQFAIGEYKNDYSDSDYISNISYQYGLNNILTINSGAIIASKWLCCTNDFYSLMIK